MPYKALLRGWVEKRQTWSSWNFWMRNSKMDCLSVNSKKCPTWRHFWGLRRSPKPTKQFVASFRMIHVKDSRSYQWAKFGRLGPIMDLVVCLVLRVMAGIWLAHIFQMDWFNHQLVHPWKIRWNLNIAHLKRVFIFQTSIFGVFSLIFHEPWRF